jgi:diguanylate cyclase (GGDEF)-like protein
MADVHAALALALSVPVVIGEAMFVFQGSAPTLALTVGYVCLQVALGLAVGGSTRGARGLFRFVLAVIYVGTLMLVEPRVQATLPVLYIPTIVLAAATSLRAGLVVAITAAAMTRISMAILFGPSVAFEQNILPVVVVAMLVFGTRHVVASLERSLARLRKIATSDRRRARRLRAFEEVGRILAQEGPVPSALEGIMEVLTRTFGFLKPSVYLWTGSELRLGGQRGYDNPIEVFDLNVGIIGRVARTREAVFAPDVSRVPEYREADSSVVSEISVPLLSDGQLLGVLNIESTAAEPLDREDFASMQMIADRLSASIALGRRSQELAERAALLGRLTDAFASLGGTLDPATLRSAIATAATTVLGCDIAILTLGEPDGAYRVVAAVGADVIIGMPIEPGEGATGQAIQTRAAVLDDKFDRSRYPRAARKSVDDPTVAVMAIPMLRDEQVAGALTFVRRSTDHGFTEQEREIAHLLAGQASLAIANADLHEETRQASLRDPLTGLHNRRLLDDALARMTAQRSRQAPKERRAIATILFDLDHFGALNKRYGHQAGDAVLRAFGEIVASRFRASDLVARYGGEEFLVILDGATRDDAVRAAEEIRTAFAATEVAVPGGGEPLRATVSAGCAALDQTSAGVEPMIEVADVGLAMAKAGGRNQVVAA